MKHIFYTLTIGLGLHFVSSFIHGVLQALQINKQVLKMAS